MKQHVIYIPGLTDRYDPFRRLGLMLWRRPSVAVTLIPMRWEDPEESYESKLSRIHQAIDKYADRKTILVGESAGGPVAIVAMKWYREKVDRVITVCGMNQGTDRVSKELYQKNSAFHDAMIEADRLMPHLSDEEKEAIMTIYSSNDGVVSVQDTLIEGVERHDIKVPIHSLAIGYVLFVRPDLVIKR